MLVAKKKEYYQEEKPDRQKKQGRVKTKAKAPKGSLYTKKKIKLGPMISLIFLACTIVAVVLSYVAIHAAMAKTAYEISKMEKQINSLQNENEQLQLQIMNLTSLDRIEEVARTKLGMARPDEVQFVALPITEMPKKVADTPFVQEESTSKKVLSMVDQVYKTISKHLGDTVTAEAGTF